MNLPNQLPPHVQLMQFILGKWISKPIHAAAELGVADLLAEGPKHIDELARLTGTHAPALYRMLRALAGLGIFAETVEQQFELTPMAEYLKSGALRSIAQMSHAPWNDRAWDFFLHSLKTGETAFEKAHGMPIAPWLEQHPEEAHVLSQANAVKATVSHRAIADAYDFSGINTLADLGGGYGTLMIEVLKANFSLKGVVADLPAVIPGAEKNIRERGLQERCRTVPCDFFREVPGGMDAYMLSHILHDWPDEKCRVILENCYRAMEPGTKLLVVEMMVPPGNTPSVAKLLDLEMMVVTGGRERTEEEFKELLETTGFRFSRTFPTGESIFIIEGIRE